MTAVLASAVQAQMAGMEISSFRVPEYDEKGAMTSQLFGERAEVGEGGEVNITGLRMEFYKDGKTAMTVASPYCLYNQKTREARSDAPVSADMEKVRVRGKGFFLKPGESTVRVLDSSQVIIEGLSPETAGGTVPGAGSRQATNITVITSKELFLNYKQKNVRFEQDVHVRDPKMVMECQTLEIRFSENNEINWIEALTGVRILSEGREATAGKAVYDVHNDEFVLEEHPRLRDGKNVLSGDRVRFWRASGRMICEPQARLVIYPDKNIKTDFFGK